MVKSQRKLTDADVRFIRLSELSKAEMARLFAVDRRTIQHVISHVTYKKVRP